MQDDHFWVVPRVVVLYSFDCNFKKVFLKDGWNFKILIYKIKKSIRCKPEGEAGLYTENLWDKKCKSTLLLQITEKAVFMLLCNTIRKILNWQRRIEKEITLLNFRGIDPKRIVVIVKCNPNLVLALQENVQIFLLATISRRNAKKK